MIGVSGAGIISSKAVTNNTVNNATFKTNAVTREVRTVINNSLVGTELVVIKYIPLGAYPIPTLE